VRKHLDPNATPADPGRGSQDRSNYRALFHRPGCAAGALRRPVLFCQVVPYFALFTFLPTVLAALKIEGDLAQSVIDETVPADRLGGGNALVNRMDRRPFILGSFLVLAAVTIVRGCGPEPRPRWSSGFFAVFAFAVSSRAGARRGVSERVFPTTCVPPASGW